MSKIKCLGLFDWSYSEGIKSNWQALKISPYLIRSYYGVFLHHSRQRDCNSLQEVEIKLNGRDGSENSVLDPDSLIPDPDPAF
jgi:hypothetical protein